MSVENSTPEQPHNRTSEFMQLLVPNQRRILGFILTLVPNITDAEDILQDTLTEMWNKFDQFTPGSNFAAWGCTIARFKILEFRRKHKNKRLLFSDELLQTMQTEISDHNSVRTQYGQALQNCIKKLKPKEIDYLKHRYVQNLTLKEMANHIGITLQGIHKTLTSIHLRLLSCIRSSVRNKESL